MSTTSQGIKVGPLHLVPGVSRMNLWAYLYASFICIGILAGMNFLQPYVLTENLNIPRGAQGTVSGDLGLWQEIVAILLINPFGWLSDRIGRRPLMVFGIVVCGIGYGLYPFAESIEQLTLYRIIFAVGASCLAALIAVVANDYPAESSRGKMIGFGNMMNGVGVIFMTAVIAQIPRLASAQGVNAVAAGQIMFLVVMVLCLLSAIWFHVGLQGGTPVTTHKKPEGWALITSGIRAGRNPRILLSYGAAFIGRADVSIKGMFLSLWAVSLGPEVGLDPANAMGKAGQLLGIMSIAGMAWVVAFGFIMDRLNRVTGMAIAMGLGGVGYSSMWLVDSPLNFSMLPFFLVLSIGQVSVILASVTLVGQEARPEERGAVVAMNGFFGAVGILLAFVIGGRLFDAIGPQAPFVMVGILQLVLFVAAVAIRLAAPGEIGETRSGRKISAPLDARAEN
jgi:MFS family permease